MEPLFSPEIHDFYERTSIPLAVFYVEDGRFRTYLVSEGICRMYETPREKMLERLNGSDPFVNVVEKKEMLGAVADFSENDVKYNVVFHEYVGPDRKLITVHGVGQHEYTDDGRRYSVIRYDEISDSSRRFLFRDEQREMAEREKLIVEIDDAIARSYTSVIYIDTEDMTAYAVRLNRFARELEPEVRKTPTLRNLIDVYVRTLVYRDDADGVLRFGDYDYVMERLKQTNPIYHTYRTILDGQMVYYRLKIIPFDGGRKLIYGFEYFDDQVRDQLARRNEHDIQTTLLAGLSCEYETVWLVDAQLHNMTLIRNNIKYPPTSKEIGSVKEGRYETLVGNYIDKFVTEEDRERMYLETSLDNLMRNTKEGEIFQVNYERLCGSGSKRYFQFCVVRVTDAAGNVRFVCGIRNIDAMVEEEKNRNLLYGMANKDHLTMLGNRRVFDEFMDRNKLTRPSKDTVFLSMDINSLRETNDLLGHEAADEMITGAAKCMKEVLGEYGDLFRTGGDEFAGIIVVGDDKREELIKRLEDGFAAWKGSAGGGLSVSMGYVCASENEGMLFEDMRREAEGRMNARKSDHYMQDGNDRRRTGKNGGK